MKKGLVIRSTGSWYSVKDESGKIFNCKVRGKFRIKGIRSTNPVAVGDQVFFDTAGDEDTGIITELLDRKNYIIRKSSNFSKHSHIIAANLDQALLVVTINYPVTTTAFIDRYLISAEAYRIPAILIFNKTDLYGKKEFQKLNEYKDIYEKIGYKCLEVSAVAKANIDQIKDILKDRISVISGHSGVGKSTLINVIDPNLNLKTKEISDYHRRGKHTTTYTEMFAIESGGYIIDTPGIKGFGVIDMYDEEIYHFFPEMFKLSKDCQYYNCTHTHEPGCAVKEGVENGTISESRYISYLDIMAGDDKYRGPGY